MRPSVSTQVVYNVFEKNLSSAGLLNDDSLVRITQMGPLDFYGEVHHAQASFPTAEETTKVTPLHQSDAFVLSNKETGLLRYYDLKASHLSLRLTHSLAEDKTLLTVLSTACARVRVTEAFRELLREADSPEEELTLLNASGAYNLSAYLQAPEAVDVIHRIHLDVWATNQFFLMDFDRNVFSHHAFNHHPFDKELSS